MIALAASAVTRWVQSLFASRLEPHVSRPCPIERCDDQRASIYTRYY